MQDRPKLGVEVSLPIYFTWKCIQRMPYPPHSQFTVTSTTGGHWNQVNVTCCAFSSCRLWKTRIGALNTVKKMKKEKACIEKQSVTNYERKGA